MIVTLNPNGLDPATIGLVTAMVAQQFGGRKKGYVPHVFWVAGGTARKTIERALDAAARQMHLPEGAISILRIDGG